MQEGTKLLGLLGLLWWATSKPKAPTPKKKAEAKKEPGTTKPADEARPEDAKPEPGPLVDLEPIFEEFKKKKAEKKADQAEKRAEPEKKAEKKPKADEKPAEKRAPQATEPDAAELAGNHHKIYLEEGFEPEIAAAEALSIYLLAGGTKPEIIASYQRKIGVEPSGWYDKETSNNVAKNLGMALDGAINGFIQLTFAGEQPDKAAGDMLLQYLTEGQDIGEPPVRVKVAALQIAMGVHPISGRYDANTKDKLTQLGIVPIEFNE